MASIGAAGQTVGGRPAHSLHVFTGGALQQPRILRSSLGEARVDAQHLFLGVEYAKRFNARWSWGVQAASSWTSFGFRIRAEVNDPMGSRMAEAAYRTGFFWFPFQRSLLTGTTMRTDPFQVALLLKRDILGSDRSRLDGSLGMGIMPRWNWIFTRSWSVEDPWDRDRLAAIASMSYGLETNPFMLLQLTWRYQLPNSDRITIGLDHRMTWFNYFYSQALFAPGTMEEVTVAREMRFIWLGLRAGYTFTWGAPRKPRWVRQMEEQGLPLPRQ